MNNRPRRALRFSRFARALAAAMLAPALVVVGVLIPAAPAQAEANFNVACGDIYGPLGLVGMMDLGNRTPGTVTVALAPGCTYVVDEPAWNWVGSDKVYYDSAFWPINDRISHGHLIVEGNGATITRPSDGPRYRFFDLDWRGELTLKDLTISGGLAPHGYDANYYIAGYGESGGAIRNDGRLTLVNVTMTNNTSGHGENGSDGGSGDGYPGGEGGDGGAIFNSGTLVVSGSTIVNNRSGSGGNGGGGWWNGGRGGKSGDGAGVANQGSLTVTDSTILNNYSGDVGIGGGGAYGAPTATKGRGAGIYSASGSVVVNRSLLKGNRADGALAGEGGAIAIGGGSLSVNNSTFSSNLAWRGGALHLTNATGTVRNSTFSDNDATGDGDQNSGDVAAMDRGATLSFANTVMTNNDAGQKDCDMQVFDPEVTYSSLGGLISDENTDCGTNTVLLDPNLEALGDFGGPTWSRLPRANSALLGAGVAAYCGGVDQRGAARPASGCDVGAVERVTVTTPGSISGPAVVPLNTATAFTASSSSGGAPLTYSWSVSGVGATFSSSTVASPNITFTSSGIAILHLNVRLTGSSPSETVTVSDFTVKVPPAGNRPPTLAWTGTPASAVNEGDTTRFSYSYSDPDGDSLSAPVGYPYCGTVGSITSQSRSAGAGWFDCEFPNGQANSTVTMRIEDQWSTPTTVTQVVAVAEVAPTITVIGDSTANEGTVTSYAYTIHEPGSDTFTPVTNCVGTGSSKVAGSDVYTPGTHDTSGRFECRWALGPASTAATVTANGGAGSKSVTVSNVAPSVAISGGASVDENGATQSTLYRYLLNATDPGDQSSLSYVSGSASCGGSAGFVVSADLTAVVCRFANGPGSALVTAQVRDPSGALSTGGGQTVTVNNVAPTVTVTQPSGPVVEGDTAYYAVTATDPGLDVLTITAPNGCTAGSVNAATLGRLTATLACVYADGPGTRSRTVQVSDGVASGTAVVTGQQVLNSAPTIDANFVTPWTRQHETVTLIFGAVTDPGTDTVTSVRVNWGDGSHTDLVWPVPAGEASHVYVLPGQYTPTIDLVDEDGTHADRGPDLWVYAYDAIASTVINAPLSAVEGTPTTITFSVNEDFEIDYLMCYEDYSTDPMGIPVLPTNLVVTARGGSFQCTWPQWGMTAEVYLGIVDAGWTMASVQIENSPSVITWDDPTPVTVTEDNTRWVRFHFHASDIGARPLSASAFWEEGNYGGCGSGNLMGNTSGTARPVFDPATGAGYVDCMFLDGPQAAHVGVGITDGILGEFVTRTVTVLNAEPIVTLRALAGSVDEGSSVEFEFSVSDAEPNIFTILNRSCGTGGTVTRIMYNGWSGGFTCRYDDGPVTALASVTVSDGHATVTGVAAVQVIDQGPVGELTGGDFYEPDQDYTLTLANLRDAGIDTVHTVVIDWGDGSTSRVTDGSRSFTHRYQGIGTHTISLSIVDEDGESVIGTKQVRDVDHVFPVFTPHGDQTIERNWDYGSINFWPTLHATDDRGVVLLGCWPDQVYYLGDVSMQCFAHDAAGNVSWDYWTLHVVDTVLPVLTPSQTRFEATSTAGAVVTFGVSVVDKGLPAPMDQRALNCSLASGTLLPIGDTPVHCSATDDAGNTGIVDFTITVADTTPPAVTAPAGFSVSATGPGGATATYSAATAYDTLSGELTPSCTPVSGSTFSLGVTTVTCSATDGAGNVGSAGFTVTVVDDVKPVVTTSGDLLVEPTGPSGALVDYEAATAHDAVDGDLDPEDVVCSAASGSLFALGATIVTCTGTDAHGNVGSASFTVTVQDKAAPLLPAPASIGGGSGHPIGLVVEAEGPDGAHVDYEKPVATDLVDGVLDVECSPAPDSLFALGQTIVTCTAVDSNGNVGTLVFPVTVVDTTAPALGTLPAPPDTEATSSAGAVVSYAAPTATDLVDGEVVVSCSPASGSTFLLGTTTVTCSTTDSRGNDVATSFTVTVVDTTEPVLDPVDLRVGAEGDDGSTVDFVVLATDVVDGEFAAACDYDSGHLFPADVTTTVTCSATDVHGNIGDAAFTIEVYGAILTEDEAEGATELEISREIFAVGDYVVIDEGTPDEEVRLVEELGSIIVVPIAHAHPTGTIVSVIGSAPAGDTTAPAISFTAPGSVRVGTVLTVPVTCTDAGVGVQSCVVPPLPTLALGENVVTIRAWDRNGNASTAELRYTVVAPGTAGLAITGGAFGPAGSLGVLLLLAGVCLLAYRRWSTREVW